MHAQKAVDLDKSSQSFGAFFEQQMSRPSSTGPSTSIGNGFIPALTKTETETSDDILAQINGGGPVDRSSYYPPPTSPVLACNINEPLPTSGMSGSAVDDDDVFGVFENMRQRAALQAQESAHPGQVSSPDNNDFDVLGDLAKPVQPRQARRQDNSERNGQSRRSPSASSSDSSDDEDLRRAKSESLKHTYSTTNATVSDRDQRSLYVGQLVAMGFTEKQAIAALAQTASGTNVGEAAELLLSLQIAPKESSRKSSPIRKRDASNKKPQVDPEKQAAGEFGQAGDWVDSTYTIASKTLASANTWFSNKSAMARRKLAEYNASQAAATYDSRFDERPKWMRDAERHERKAKGKAKAKAIEEEEDDALREEGLPMHPSERRRLEQNGVLPPSSKVRRGSIDSTKSAKSLTGSIKSIPESLRSIGATLGGQHSAKLASSSGYVGDDPRQLKANDDEAANFVSSRRRRPPASAQSSTSGMQSKNAQNGQSHSIASQQPSKIEEEDLFGAPSPRLDKGKGKARAPPSHGEDSSQQMSNAGASYKGQGKAVVDGQVDLFSTASRPATEANLQTTINRSRAPRRNQVTRKIPYVDAKILATSSQNRLKGSEAFKRGDFAKALTFYDSSLSGLPDSHPIRVLCLTNRAITQIQLGASKSVVTDCDEALKIIGPLKGANETIEDTDKKILMTTLYNKAMTRKATALEMQEKAGEALSVWQELVRSGHGGPQALESRQRCEALTQPKPKSKNVPPKAPSASFQASSQAGRAAVLKLRAENEKAAEAEAERDSLYESVEKSIAAWSAGKEQNIRALLSSLDQVLWPTSGWKKVTLADLVINSKVKIIYMKALAKVHPDKISRDASVEEKMIAANVFSKLNGAWDSFKATNNM